MKAATLYILMVVAILGLAIWWESYKFQECKKVGHATMYCVFNIGGK